MTREPGTSCAPSATSSRPGSIGTGIRDPSPDDVASVRNVLGDGFADIASASGPVFQWSGEPSDLQEVGHPDLLVKVAYEDRSLDGVIMACAYWWREGSTITRGEFVFKRVRHARDNGITRYLLGILIGLNTHRWGGGAMADYGWRRSNWYIPLELQAIRMMYERRDPGYIAPDRAPDFEASGFGGKGLVARLGPAR